MSRLTLVPIHTSSSSFVPRVLGIITTPAQIIRTTTIQHTDTPQVRVSSTARGALNVMYILSHYAHCISAGVTRSSQRLERGIEDRSQRRRYSRFSSSSPSFPSLLSVCVFPSFLCKFMLVDVIHGERYTGTDTKDTSLDHLEKTR